jgi:cytochrome c
VRLRVRDAHGAESEASTDILVGNTPPSVTIGIDGNRSFYWSDGSSVGYDVHVTDREDGTLGRGVDPSRVVVTMSYGPSGGAAAAAPTAGDAQSPAVPEGLALIRKSDCLACHGIDNASVGPSYTAVAQRYATHPEARVQLVAKIASGGTGVWGDRVMPPHPNVSEEDRRAMVAYILSLASNRLPPRGRATLAPHPEAPGGSYRLTASYADVPRNGIGPLTDTAFVVIRPPRVLAASGSALHAIGIGKGVGADGTTHMLTTAYADTAWLSLGRLDLTGVGRVTVELRQARSPHSFTVELRDGGPTGAVLGRADARAGGPAWTTATIPVTAQGEYPLYLVLRSPDRQIEQFDPMVTIDALRFEKR